jgi:hypothetical protein
MVAIPPRTSVKIGFSLSTVRRHSRDNGAFRNGFIRAKPKKTIAINNRLKFERYPKEFVVKSVGNIIVFPALVIIKL